MMGMHWLSTEYAYFKFDPTVRTVTFDNSLVPIPWAGVWGLVKIKGQWQPPEDWTAKAAMTWCRDDRNEDIEELVISFTNNEWQDTTKTVDPGRDRPTLRAYPTGCVGWIGTSMLTNTITSTDPTITIVETVQTSMRFALDSALFVPGEPHQYWKTVGGSISWQARVTGDCTGSGQGSVSIPNSQDDHVADLNIWPEGGRMHHSGGNGPWPGDIPTYTVTCSNGQSTTMILYAAVGFFVTDGDKDELAPDGKSFGGDFQNQPAPGIKVHHRYSFRCAAGC
jgi:hypothetical protein